MSDTASTRDLAPIDPERVRTPLRVFRVLAIVVAIGLLLVVVEVIMHYGYHNESLYWWLPVHGYLYIAYCVATFWLGTRMKWGLGRMAIIMLAGWVPFLSFYAEYRTTQLVRAEFGGHLPTDRVAYDDAPGQEIADRDVTGQGAPAEHDVADHDGADVQDSPAVGLDKN
ncbi:DUF3817 domain-containing protein [Rudaeicoccus suwonensis]|uniref:Integral membrane protein n=1 Tax=Rudaeicoccus suwonensis TaxID=657409 RepID=A0A561E8H6_9MICO|nr:DUF3817 domain-containing protein [Rudaeicoccus suwonensis]TWE11911.1 integral membrane protein [Rudaeicoccus suwonensis]